jgi:hypothetical protein
MASKEGRANPVTGDAGPGTGLADILPTSATGTNDYEKQVQQESLSHALATTEQEIKGHAQVDHVEEAKDLGWNEPKEDIAEPLVGGMDNEELWMLVRRFDKVSWSADAI